jgi:hypothetical protein
VNSLFCEIEKKQCIFYMKKVGIFGIVKNRFEKTRYFRNCSKRQGISGTVRKARFYRPETARRARFCRSEID